MLLLESIILIQDLFFFFFPSRRGLKWSGSWKQFQFTGLPINFVRIATWYLLRFLFACLFGGWLWIYLFYDSVLFVSII